MKRIKPLYRNIIICVIVFIVLYITINKSFVISSSSTEQGTFGIIDGYITTKPKNVVFNQTAKLVNKKTTHGDIMIQFSYEVSPNINLYYFDASDEEGQISTEKIIEGLEWMRNNSVHKVNISLSSKSYSQELQDWLKSHRDIKVFASYNNVIKTNDYPAKYDFVYASGYDARINYKKIDIKYNSNKIILLSEKIKYYKGTSYLSLISMLKQ